MSFIGSQTDSKIKICALPSHNQLTNQFFANNATHHNYKIQFIKNNRHGNVQTDKKEFNCNTIQEKYNKTHTETSVKILKCSDGSLHSAEIQPTANRSARNGRNHDALSLISTATQGSISPIRIHSVR